MFALANARIKFSVKISCVTHGVVSCHFQEDFSLIPCFPNANLNDVSSDSVDDHKQFSNFVTIICSCCDNIIPVENREA